jgi:hypothetical protein
MCAWQRMLLAQPSRSRFGLTAGADERLTLPHVAGRMSQRLREKADFQLGGTGSAPDPRHHHPAVFRVTSRRFPSITSFNLFRTSPRGPRAGSLVGFVTSGG